MINIDRDNVQILLNANITLQMITPMINIDHDNDHSTTTTSKRNIHNDHDNDQY